MIDRTEYVINLTNNHGFPKKSISDLISSYNKIKNCEKALKIFERQVALYEKNLMFDYNMAFQNIKTACAMCGTTEETGLLLFLICLTEHLQDLYKQNNIDNSLFDGVIFDIKSKNSECYTIRKVYGTFVEYWFPRFFDLTRFAMGRLQFEPIFVSNDINVENIHIESGSLLINVHIPSGAPLVTEDCIKSFQAAYDMFSPFFDNGIVSFYCGSWMLSPYNRTILGENSNIIKFMNFFKIYEADKTIQGDLWRVFGMEDCSDYNLLPQNNTLQKAYAKCVQTNQIPVFGRGIMIMMNREIVF